MIAILSFVASRSSCLALIFCTVPVRQMSLISQLETSAFVASVFLFCHLCCYISRTDESVLQLCPSLFFLIDQAPCGRAWRACIISHHHRDRVRSARASAERCVARLGRRPGEPTCMDAGRVNLVRVLAALVSHIGGRLWLRSKMFSFVATQGRSSDWSVVCSRS